MIQEFSERYVENRNFELMMASFLALVDHKVNNRVFRRSRSAANSLAMKRIAEISKKKSSVVIPNESLVYPYQQEFHGEIM